MTELLQAHEEDPPHHTVGWLDVAGPALVALAAGAVWFHLWEPFSRLSVIGLVATLLGGYPIFREALENLVERKMTMELSMTIAIAAALAIGESFTALVITLFVLVAEILEGLTLSRGRRAIEDLLNYLPRTARVRRGKELLTLPLGQLAVGDIVLVSPGGRLPVDGAVVGGHSYVDEATITGESMPVEKLVGVGVFAGTMNQSGALEIRADRLGRDTSLGKIIEAVERAERSRAPIQKTADRLESRSEHPLGVAIVRCAMAKSVVALASDRFQSVPGRGVVCRVGQEVVVAGSRTFLEERDVLLGPVEDAVPGASEILVARGGRFVGSILVADGVRQRPSGPCPPFASWALRQSF
jgi:cation transport ATPase